MLRITHDERLAGRAILKIEGGVVADGAVLLESECSELIRSRISVTLELSGVGMVDRAGIDALRRLSGAGVEIRCSSGTVAGVLEGEGVHVTLVTNDRDGD